MCELGRGIMLRERESEREMHCVCACVRACVCSSASVHSSSTPENNPGADKGENDKG